MMKEWIKDLYNVYDSIGRVDGMIYYDRISQRITYYGDWSSNDSLIRDLLIDAPHELLAVRYLTVFFLYKCRTTHIVRRLNLV